MEKSIIENFVFCAVLQNRNSIKLDIVPENKAWVKDSKRPIVNENKKYATKS